MRETTTPSHDIQYWLSDAGLYFVSSATPMTGLNILKGRRYALLGSKELKRQRKTA